MWVARDKNEKLYLYSDKPNKEKVYWLTKGFGLVEEINRNWFPEVQWEDDEPTEIIIKKGE